jgi:lactoylglutathione lyase
MIRKIATAAVYVDDQHKAVEFWTKQIGFEVHRQQPMGPQGSWIEVGPRQRSRAWSFIQNQ